MPPDPAEVGITNLGPVPEGMTLVDALRAARGQRKHVLDVHKDDRRMTICSCLREIWRIAEAMGDEDLKELAEASFDMGKRMDARINELKCR